MAEDGIKTPELMEEERVANVDHAMKISKATLAVEEVLLAHDLTWEEWGAIIDTMNARTQTVFGRTKVAAIKESYN